jgi:hypothetical protein
MKIRVLSLSNSSRYGYCRYQTMCWLT